MKTISLPVAALAALSILAGTKTFAQPPAPGAVRVRGTVESIKGGILTISSVSGPVRVQFPAKTPVVSVVPSDRSHVKEGAFLGIASVPGKGGVEQAREVVVFPEAARGTGEGSYDWDLPSAAGTSKMTNGKAVRSRMTNGTAAPSRMTNGTVARSRMTNGTVKNTLGGSNLILEFKNGSGNGTQALTLPEGIPFVTFEPGQMSQLAQGAHVVVFGHRASGKAVTADRVLVGKNGLVPPM